MADVLDPAIVDLDRVAAWMDERALGSGPITDVELIAGGTQNVLVRFRRGDGEFVLRRPPPHKRANSDETMRREARVLGALAGTDVPHPGLIAAEPELDVIGAAFYLMEPVDGFNATLGLPEPHASDVGMQREMGLSMADAIGALAACRPRRAGAHRPRRARRLGRAPGAAVAQAARRLPRAARVPGSVDPAARRRRRVARRAPTRRTPGWA